jgi:hypothetical protein
MSHPIDQQTRDWDQAVPPIYLGKQSHIVSAHERTLTISFIIPLGRFGCIRTRDLGSDVGVVLARTNVLKVEQALSIDVEQRSIKIRCVRNHCNRQRSTTKTDISTSTALTNTKWFHLHSNAITAVRERVQCMCRRTILDFGLDHR